MYINIELKKAERKDYISLTLTELN